MSWSSWRRPPGLVSTLALLTSTLVFSGAATGLPGGAPPALAQATGERYSVLVFSKTTHHEDHRPASDAGDAAITQMGLNGDFSVTLAGDEGAPLFTHAGLRQFDVIVFNNNGGENVLSGDQRIAFERWMQRGGGAVGIHGASNSDTNWAWFDDMVGGAWFRDHPSGALQFQNADVEVEDASHPATEHLPATWTMNDEWHAFQANPREDVHVLATLDESSYDLGGTQPMGDHPIVWCTEYDGGRHLYTGLGHGASTWANADYRTHIEAAIEWAAGEVPGDCGPQRDGLPTASSLRKVSLDGNLQNPMSLQVAPDGRVFFVEMGQLHAGPGGPEDYIGRVKVYDPEAEESFVVGEIPVHRRPGQSQNGLLGIALDPSFAENARVYLFYSAPNPGQLDGVQHISRFTFDPSAGPAGQIDLASEVVLLEVPHQRLVCCHSSGSLAFGPDGFLYASTGDDTEHSRASGYAPIDERPCGPGSWMPGDAMCLPASWPADSLHAADSRRGAGNSADLRGKILRIKPIDSATPADDPGPGSTYTVDDENLFTSGEHDHLFPGGEYDPALGRPEIYAMGLRNPFRFTIDPETGWIYEGEVGPDAQNDNAARGPRGYDEINQIREAGNHGWPFCSADNLPYRPWNFVTNAPAGDFYDCEGGPTNDSPHNTGLEILPPATAPLIWYPYGSSTEFPELPLGSGRAAFAGPVYRHDPGLDSEVKLGKWFDGKLIWADWSRRWLATTALDQNGDYAGTEQLMSWENFVRPHEFELGPDGALYIFEWGNDYNYAGTGINPDSGLFRIEQRKGTQPPVATASASRTAGGVPLTVDFRGDDSDQGGERPTYEWDFGDGETSDEPNPTHTFTEVGDHEVTLTVSDSTSTDETTLRITVLPEGACLPPRSDEFEAAALDSKWQQLRWDPDRDDATVADGGLVFPLGKYGFDQDRPGPVTILGQPMPAGDWSVEAKIDAPGLNEDTGDAGSNYAKVGLIVFQENVDDPDKHWISYQHARNADGGATTNTYFEATAQNGDGAGNWTLGDRVGNAPAAENLPTFWLRITRTGSAIEGFYSLEDPDAGGTWTSLNAGAAASLDIDQFMPAGDGPVYIGAYGANGSISVTYDYVRFAPEDDCPDPTAPTTTATLDPPNPGAGGTYDQPVEVTMSAADGEGDDASGVEFTEYRVTSDGSAGEWTRSDNADGDEPFATSFNIAEDGEHRVEFRSADIAGNVEDPPGQVEFAIDDGSVASDCDTFAVGETWSPDVCEIVLGGEVTWHFDQPAAQVPHDVWLVPPGGDPNPSGDLFEVTDGAAQAGDPPVSHAFAEEGTWAFVCRIHSFQAEPGEPWQGMVGTVEVGELADDTTSPFTAVQLNGAAPAPAYDGPVTATFTATDPGDNAAGVERTEYRIDGEEWTTYSELSPPTVTGAGPHTLDYRSNDNAGNLEDLKSVEFEITEAGGTPRLMASVKPKGKTTRAGKKVRFRLRVANAGDAATGKLRLCARAPKRKAKVVGKRCQTVGGLAADRATTRVFNVKPKRALRGSKAKIRFVAAGKGVAKARAAAMLKVRR